MSMGSTRRQAIAGAGVAAGVAALPLKPAEARIKKDQKAPIIEIFDSRGCEVQKSNYQGQLANNENDEMCIKVTFDTIAVSPLTAEKKLQEFVGGKASSINVDQISGVTKKY